MFLIGLPGRSKQLKNLLSPEPGGHVRSFEQCVSHRFFACMQAQDLLLNRASGDEPVDCYRTNLPDPVGPVGGLVLDRRIPLGVKVQDIVGTHEIQAGSAGFQADQKQRRAPLVELLDQLEPLGRRRCTVKILAGDPRAIQFGADERKVRGELAER